MYKRLIVVLSLSLFLVFACSSGDSGVTSENPQNETTWDDLVWDDGSGTGGNNTKWAP